MAPSGCTANFVFGGLGNPHIGTARHCVGGVGDELVMQVDSVTLASVGTVVQPHVRARQPGNDFALIRIDPAVATRWGVTPAIPVIGGPNGVYTGCGPVPVAHFGHGYGVAVGQGKPEGGIAADWSDDAYAWAGFGLPGDSGSPVITATGQAAGNFTHLVVGGFAGNLAGMRATRLIQVAGLPIANANGSTVGRRDHQLRPRPAGLAEQTQLRCGDRLRLGAGCRRLERGVGQQAGQPGEVLAQPLLGRGRAQRRRRVEQRVEHQPAGRRAPPSCGFPATCVIPRLERVSSLVAKLPSVQITFGSISSTCFQR